MNKHYHITYFCGFPATDKWRERYEEAIECGFDLLPIEHGDVCVKKDILRFLEEKGALATLLN